MGWGQGWGGDRGRGGVGGRDGLGGETQFLLLDSLKVSEVGERGRGQGGSSLVSRARLSRVCPARLREEGGRCQLSCKLRELLIPVEVATMVMLAS